VVVIDCLEQLDSAESTAWLALAVALRTACRSLCFCPARVLAVLISLILPHSYSDGLPVYFVGRQTVRGQRLGDSLRGWHAPTAIAGELANQPHSFHPLNNYCLQAESFYDVALLLKHYLRQLPSPLIPLPLQEMMLEVRSGTLTAPWSPCAHFCRLEPDMLKLVMEKLPKENLLLLRYALCSCRHSSCATALIACWRACLSYSLSRCLMDYLSVFSIESAHFESNSAVSLAMTFTPLIMWQVRTGARVVCSF
jgi:hypothetical protein